jgi:hypothetical protein
MYTVDLDPVAEQQRIALPPEAMSCYAELLTMLEVAPWGGEPFRQDKPEGNMRKQVFGAGRGIAA